MSGEFAYVYTFGAYAYHLLDDIAEMHINGDDDHNGTDYAVTPKFGEALQVVAKMAKRIAWAEAGDSGEIETCNAIILDLPALREKLAVLEAYCNEVITRDG